jgi:hypothetical protein
MLPLAVDPENYIFLLTMVMPSTLHCAVLGICNLSARRRLLVSLRQLGASISREQSMTSGTASNQSILASDRFGAMIVDKPGNPTTSA